MPRPNSKRQKALDAISRAQAEVGKALSLLGGRTRYKPRVVTRQYTARQYLESIDQRLQVVTDLVMLGENFAVKMPNIILGEATRNLHIPPGTYRATVTSIQGDDINVEIDGVDLTKITEDNHTPGLRSDFERAYDAERKPEC